jgi:hypothetical protein
VWRVVKTLALVADSREWLIMHQECGRAADPVQHARNRYWYAADVTNAVNGIMGDPCAWCQRKLGDEADPALLLPS